MKEKEEEEEECNHRWTVVCNEHNEPKFIACSECSEIVEFYEALS